MAIIWLWNTHRIASHVHEVDSRRCLHVTYIYIAPADRMLYVCFVRVFRIYVYVLYIVSSKRVIVVAVAWSIYICYSLFS